MFCMCLLMSAHPLHGGTSYIGLLYWSLYRLLARMDESVEKLKGQLAAQSRGGTEQNTSQTVDR